MKAIETHYMGYRFRSRLEARWAVFFETLGGQWEYEPEGFDLNGLYYLPDFRVRYPGGSVYWFEVKSSVENLTDEDVRKMTLFARYIDDINLLDGTPEFGTYLNFSKYNQGLLYEIWDQITQERTDSISIEEHIVLDEELRSSLNNLPDDEIVSLNLNLFKSHNPFLKSIKKPTERFGDILFTSKDGGRLWFGEYGESVDSNWHPLLTQAITAARSARFEHGENPGRY